jgi:hypothetical protein
MRATWQEWQIEETGPLVPAKGSHPWYGRNSWKKGFRVAELQRHPVCCLCERNPSTMVDHIRPFISPEGYVSWALFSDPANHRALCKSCHDTLTSTYDGGFGNPRKAGKETHVLPTGAGGRQFTSTSVGVHQLDAALPQSQAEIDDLLSGIPG